ncbi:hypothetical protein F3P66_07160 [Agrobacterium fabrum]|uniref:Uncharacterized protein n=1 Tax=Agrobacterium fabrum (strain C58 / ATCC 33970) TaxID=176299 RepID=Q8UFH0_AGRFC|nr:hypothetical protein Atu1427 [Agrobacterium fabrum str. C58]QKW96650.1 hypothetical protein GSF67_05820 [Agrobacterium sp. CGMCC 11546]QRM59245.1 hypothetical protein F3P66_07160 [Agrobacterium fabrum]TRB30663.1 hypothetical protein EXN51_00305 [Agrobacterium fabrum]
MWEVVTARDGIGIRPSNTFDVILGLVPRICQRLLNFDTLQMLGTGSSMTKESLTVPSPP